MVTQYIIIISSLKQEEKVHQNYIRRQINMWLMQKNKNKTFVIWKWINVEQV